jgi:hypothetical protein
MATKNDGPDMPSEAKNKSSLSKKISLLRAAKIPNTMKTTERHVSFKRKFRNSS